MPFFPPDRRVHDDARKNFDFRIVRDKLSHELVDIFRRQQHPRQSAVLDFKLFFRRSFRSRNREISHERVKMNSFIPEQYGIRTLRIPCPVHKSRCRFPVKKYGGRTAERSDFRFHKNS